MRNHPPKRIQVNGSHYVLDEESNVVEKEEQFVEPPNSSDERLIVREFGMEGLRNYRRLRERYDEEGPRAVVNNPYWQEFHSVLK